MAFLDKVYTLDRHENFEGFLNAIGPDLSDDFKQAILNHKQTTKISKNGDKYTMVMSTPSNSDNEVTFESGVEFEETVRTKKAKTTITVDGNTVTHQQKFDVGITFNFKREFNGDELVVTITSSNWDGEARRYYKA